MMSRLSPQVQIVAAPDPTLAARVKALEAELRTARAVAYRGVAATGSRYRQGEFATHGGSLWHCDCDTTATPGEDPASWTLAVKRGRDGKDAK